VLEDKKFYDEEKALYAEYQSRIAEMDKRGEDLALFRLREQERQITDSLRRRAEAGDQAAARALETVEQYFAKQRKLIEESHQDWITSLSQISQAFDTFGKALGVQALSDIGNIVGGLGAGTAAGVEMKNAIADFSDNAVVGLGSVAQAAGKMMTALKAATSSADALLNAVGGAVSGAAAGASVASKAGPWGAILGAIAGGLYGYFSTPDAEQQAREKANAQIQSLKQQLLGTYGSFENIQKIANALGSDLMRVWSTANGPDGLQALNHEIDKFNWALKETAEFIAELQNLPPGQALSDVVVQQIKSGKLTDDAKAAIGQFILKTQGTLGTEIADYLKTNPTLAVNGTATAGGRGIFSAATANASGMIASGQSWADVAKTMVPIIDEISKRTGISSSFADRLNLAASEQIAPLLQQAKDLGDITVSAQNIGELNAGTFKDLTAGLGDTAQQLAANNVSQTDILEFMKPTLQQIWVVAQKTGYTVDEATADLMKQEEQNGLLGEKYKSADEQLKDSIDALIASIKDLQIAFYHRAPDFVALPPGAVVAPTSTADVDPSVYGGIPVPYENNDTTDYFGKGNLRSYDVGGLIDEDQFARIHAGELIGPVSFMKRAIAGALSDMGGSFGGPSITIPINVQALDVTDFARIVRDKIAPEISEAIRNNVRGIRSDLRLHLGVA
jgi:hypothetical protein